MTRSIPELPKVGDRVRLRGREPKGILRSVTDRNWAQVDWDAAGPLLCHLHELERQETAE